MLLWSDLISKATTVLPIFFKQFTRDKKLVFISSGSRSGSQGDHGPVYVKIGQENDGRQGRS